MHAIGVRSFGHRQKATRSLGTSIRWRRLAIGISQEQLAARMTAMGDHVRQSDVSRLELDRISKPSQRRLDAIAYALDWTPAELLKHAGYSPQTHTQIAGMLRLNTFQRKLEVELRRAQRGSKPLVLLIIRVGRLEALIDRPGGLDWDEVLRQVAESLCAGLRESDVVAQHTDVEFVVLLPEMSAPAAVRVRDRIQDMLPLTVNNVDEIMTISIGQSSYPEDGETVEDLLKSAVMAAFARERQLEREEANPREREAIQTRVRPRRSQATE